MTPRQAPGRAEFIALMAMLAAIVAFSIDAMLPALPDIGAAFTPAHPNRAQLVVSAFLFGLGIGTFVAGPLSDSFGRKPVILAGAVLYIGAAGIAMLTQSLEMLIIARIAQGFGASGARIVALAIIRDLYEGRGMARIISFVMMVFTLVPAIAPLIGTGIIALTGWRGIFASFIAFAILSSLWLSLRLPEPLPKSARKPFHLTPLKEAAREVLSPKLVRISVMVQVLCFATLFSSISSVQQIVSETFGRADQFPYWFAMVAMISGVGGVVNASLVLRLGMRRLISFALSTQIILCLAALVLTLMGGSVDQHFAIYIIWQTSVFFQVALTIGNLTSLAMQPLGHIAGMAASVISGLATVGSVLLTIPIGLAFNGTPIPLMIGVLICMCGGRFLMRWLEA